MLFTIHPYYGNLNGAPEQHPSFVVGALEGPLRAATCEGESLVQCANRSAPLSSSPGGGCRCQEEHRLESFVVDAKLAAFFKLLLDVCCNFKARHRAVLMSASPYGLAMRPPQRWHTHRLHLSGRWTPKPC